MKNEKFIFEISVDAVPHNKQTAEEIYGKGAYEPDKFGEESHAVDIISEVFKDSFTHSSMALMEHLAKCKCNPENMSEPDRQFYNYLKKKNRVAEAVWDSLKFSRMEKKDWHFINQHTDYSYE